LPKSWNTCRRSPLENNHGVIADLFAPVKSRTAATFLAERGRKTTNLLTCPLLESIRIDGWFSGPPLLTLVKVGVDY
jgi:hypothetical protein